jgi:hypothetical protein
LKALIDKLASGNAVYETADAEISENRIAVELEQGELYHGEIMIKGKNGMSVKGVVFSTDSHVYFENNQFNGINNTLKYTVSGKNMFEGQVIGGTISVVTTAGDYAIPFAVTIKKKVINSSIGKITDLEGFVKLVKISYDEALILFLSKEFKEFFLKENDYALALYHQVMRNTNRNIALEEFLVGMNLKERVRISIVSKIKEYSDIKENYGDVLNVSRSGWGYVDIDVEVQGDFFYNCKDKISGDAFNGKIAEYQYLINAGRLHGGSNCGRIILRSSNEKLVYDIVIVNQKEHIDDYLKNKKSTIDLVKNYLDFRTGVIDGKKWKSQVLELAEQRLIDNRNDIIGILAKAQIGILNNNDEQALEYLGRASQLVSVKNETEVVYYCYYLYLKSIYKNDQSYTYEVKEEIKSYFEGEYDKWQLLWMLFYMDERYDENPSLKYTLVKRMFNNGCVSPIMYYEAAKVLNEQPELLRVLNRFEMQTLNFAGKYHMVGIDLAKQAADIIGREREFNETYIKILSRLYEETESTDVLYCICGAIINGNKVNKEYSKWINEGVKKELKITNLYEYYIYTADTERYDRLEKSAYKYFSYGTDMLMYNKDYFYANLVSNFDETDEIYIKCRGALEKYVTQEVMKGNNNCHLRVIYERVLTDDFIVGDLICWMPKILHTYQVKIKNKNIKHIIVNHKEISEAQTVSFVDNVAYVQLYTKNPVIVFMDGRGRILSNLEYEIKKMDVNVPVSKQGSSLLTELCDVEQIMNHPADNTGRIIELKAMVNAPGLTSEFRQRLKEFIVDYYYKGYDKGDLDIYVLQMNMAELSIKSRNKVMEIMIRKKFGDMIYPYMAKYGYQGIERSLLQNVCIEMSADSEYDKNELVTEICADAFRNGCRDDNLLIFLGKYYESGSIELYQLYLAMKAKNIKDNTLPERLLVQYIFEGNTENKIYDIYMSYLEGSTATNIRKAFYTYVTYNYVIKNLQCPDIVWEILEQEYDDGINTPVICSIAFVEALSKRENLTEHQVKILQSLIETLAKNNVNFEFYKKFNKWFKIPFNLIDKTIIDFRTNPKHRVDITYSIKTPEGRTKKVTEEMGSIYQGIFTKEIIMFYGEEIDYSITEYSDECPLGKVVDNYSVRITEKNTYNDESRFGMINGMMICRSLGRDDAARDIMQSYALCKESGKELFKLL